MLDSGLSVSFVQCNVLQHAKCDLGDNSKISLMVTASGDKPPILQHVKASIQLGELNNLHEFVVVKSLVALIIQAIDFLQGNGLMLDFTHNPVAVTVRLPKFTSTQSSMAVAQIFPIYEATQKGVLQACAVSESKDNIVDECAIPDYTVPSLIIQCHHHQSYLHAQTLKFVVS